MNNLYFVWAWDGNADFRTEDALSRLIVILCENKVYCICEEYRLMSPCTVHNVYCLLNSNSIGQRSQCAHGDHSGSPKSYESP